jgi:hypothetical protein
VSTAVKTTCPACNRLSCGFDRDTYDALPVERVERVSIAAACRRATNADDPIGSPGNRAVSNELSTRPGQADLLHPRRRRDGSLDV